MDGWLFRNGRFLVPNWTKNSQTFVDRHVELSVCQALTDTRIVAIVGPRQSGKTTLARHIANKDGRAFVSLDDYQSRIFAQDDPMGFIRNLQSAVIDEIQRAPNLFLTLKKQVDEYTQPGRFLITGSVDLFRGAISPDSIAGRVEMVELLPFSQSEIGGASASQFLERAFANDFPFMAETSPTPHLIERILSGGYPPALERSNPSRRQVWFQSYARSLAERDVADIASVENRDKMMELINYAAIFAGKLLNMTDLGTRVGVDGKTVNRWLALLEHMFLIRRVRAWHTSELRRLVKSPKIQFLDSGLLAALTRTGLSEISRDRQKLGPLLESFVFSEITKAIALTNELTTISHYRSKDGVEVDLVLERTPGIVVGIKVKAGATAHPQDFKGLNHLKKAAADNFVCGILLHDGERVQRIDSDLYAMPISMLWKA